MIFPSLTQEITEHLAQEYARVNREQQIAYFDTRYRELEGNVFEPSDLARIWPRRFRETDESYKERVKIWTHMPKIITNRVVSMLLQGNVRREWQPIDDKFQAQADIANEFNERVMEVNDWDFRSNQIYYLTLGIGEMAMWPEYRRFDKLTGEPYAYKGVKGTGLPIWKDWKPWFVEPIVFQEYADEIIGAAKLIFMDNQLATPLLTQTVTGGEDEAITELLVAPIYNHMTGKPITKGFYRKWVNGVEAFSDNEDGTPDTVWSEENQLGCNPVVFFRSPDPDETQYRGKAYTDRFREMSIEHTRFLSTIGQATEVLPNLWIYTGDQKKIDQVVIRHNEVVQIPPDGKFEQAIRELKLEEEWKLVNYLEKTIGLLGAIPPEVWDNLGKAGKVDSGVALKLTMQPMVEQIQVTRKAFASAEKEMMRKAVRMYNAYNPGKEIDITNLRPEVIYEENLLPVDEATEIVNDLLLLDKGVKSLTDLVRKYNAQITTEQQAEDFIKKAQSQKPQPKPSVFTGRAGQNRNNQEAGAGVSGNGATGQA